MSTSVAQIRNDELNVLWRVSNGIAKGRRFKDVTTPEDALARILVGRDLGMTPTDAIAHITFSDGSPVIAAEVQGAMLRNFVGPDGERYDFDVVTPAASRDSECHITIKRREGGATTWKKRGTEIFTLEDAERAELTSGNDFYRKYPRRMLFARALTAAIAIYAPEVVHPQLDMQLAAAEILDVVGQGSGELAEGDPLRADDVVADRVDDDRSISQASVSYLREAHDYLESRGEIQRFVDTLNVIGVPEGDELIQRIVSMTENQAAELLTRLAIPGRTLGHFKRQQGRTEATARERARDERRAGEAIPA